MGWAAVGGTPGVSWVEEEHHSDHISSPSAEQVKVELEAELGLKIVQTGVGEVGVSTPRAEAALDVEVKVLLLGVSSTSQVQAGEHSMAQPQDAGGLCEQAIRVILWDS